MNRHEKSRLTILNGRSDTNIRFDDLRRLLHYLKFEECIRSSHHIFRREGIEEKPNLQRDGHKAKPYQVAQVRRLIVKYELGGK